MQNNAVEKTVKNNRHFIDNKTKTKLLPNQR